MDTYCRGCLKEYEPTELLQYSESNRRLYVYCTGLQVKRNDIFTFQLCKECYIYLKLACKFKKQCRSSDRKFKTYIGLKNAGENIDFRTYIEDMFALKLPDPSSGSSPIYRKSYNDDDNESTCTSIQNFMTDIRETLQEEDMLTTEDKLIREVIQEEADISDDSLDSHWLEDNDDGNELGMAFDFSPIGTPITTNKDRCNTSPRISDAEDTCHYVHKDVILKSDKTITIRNDREKLTHKCAINQASSDFSDDNFAEYNNEIKTSNENDMPLLDDCSIGLNSIINTNVSITEFNSEFPIVKVDKINNESIINNAELITKQSNISSFTKTLEEHKREEALQLSIDNTFEVVDNLNNVLSEDTAVLTVVENTSCNTVTISNKPFSFDGEQYNNISKQNLDNIEIKPPIVEDELELYVAKAEFKKKENKKHVTERCAIDNNLEMALKNDGKQIFPLEQLLKSPQAQPSGSSTPIVHNILFGNLTPLHINTPEHPGITEIETVTETEKNLLPKDKDVEKGKDKKCKPIRIFKGSIKSDGKIINLRRTPLNIAREKDTNIIRGYKNITKLKILQKVEEDKFKSDDAISIDENSTSIKNVTIENNEKPIPTPVTDDLDISITNLLDFDENQSVDLNISIASNFLEEEQKESIPGHENEKDFHHLKVKVNDDGDKMDVDEPEVIGDEHKIEVNEHDNNQEMNVKEPENSDDVFKKPLPPPDQYDLDKRLCNICKVKYKTVRALKMHFGKAHGAWLPRYERKNEPKVCETCGKVSPNYSAHKRHLKEHEGILRCMYCTLPFNTKGALRSHLRSHVSSHTPKPAKEGKKYLCTLCDKEFKQLGNYNTHMKRHNKDYTIKCQICEKGFVRKYDLDIHMVQHTKALPFHCELCPKQFKTRYLLVGHMYVHMGVKKFVCEHCNKVFESNQSLKRHCQDCVFKPIPSLIS